MKEQVFGPRRSRASRKPLIQCPGVVFYRCHTCGSVYQRTGWNQTEPDISCCGSRMEPLAPVRKVPQQPEPAREPQSSEPKTESPL